MVIEDSVTDNGKYYFDAVVHKRQEGAKRNLSMGMLLFSCSQFPDVELQLLSFQNVTIGTARLSGTAGDGCIETASSELGFEKGVDLGVLLLLIQAALSVVGKFHGFTGIRCRNGGFASFGDGLGIVGFVPLAEGGGIDLDDGILDEGVRSDKFVI